jgi:hypothetical protein
MLVNDARVGIVMLLYNRSDVAKVCLRSLAEAHADALWEIYLLDNASRASESETVRSQFQEHVRSGRIRGQFIRTDMACFKSFSRHIFQCDPQPGFPSDWGEQ